MISQYFKKAKKTKTMRQKEGEVSEETVNKSVFIY